MKEELKTFYALVCRDIRIFMPSYKDRILNLAVWGSIVFLVFDKIMPFTGISAGYGTFLIAGNIATLGLFDAMESVFVTLVDCQGDKPISYYLTLPVSHSMVFLRIAITNALKSLFVTLSFIPLAKLCFGISGSFARFHGLNLV